MDPLLTHEGELVSGTIVGRPNRFVLSVRFDGAPERVYLGDPGELSAIVEPGNEVLCSPADGTGRKTAYDAIAVRVGDVHVSVRAALANDLVERALERGALSGLRRYGSITREPPLPEGGRSDFLLESDAGERAYVEVKSSTHVEGGVARFPDRPTERGRRHLRSLERLADEGVECHVVFVVQRPDVEAFEPFREVDPAFADLLARVRDAGVGVRAIVTAFDPPEYHLRSADLPIDLA